MTSHNALPPPLAHSLFPWQRFQCAPRDNGHLKKTVFLVNRWLPWEVACPAKAHATLQRVKREIRRQQGCCCLGLWGLAPRNFLGLWGNVWVGVSAWGNKWLHGLGGVGVKRRCCRPCDSHWLLFLSGYRHKWWFTCQSKQTPFRRRVAFLTQCRTLSLCKAHLPPRLAEETEGGKENTRNPSVVLLSQNILRCFSCALAIISKNEA